MKKEDENLNQTNNSKFDNIMGNCLILLYIAAFVMFARYMVKSMSEMARRNFGKEKNVSAPVTKKQMSAVNYIDALKNIKQR